MVTGLILSYWNFVSFYKKIQVALFQFTLGKNKGGISNHPVP
jgi:hypothetical protein